LGLNDFRDEAGDFIEGIGAANEPIDKILAMLKEEMNGLIISKENHTQFRHQVYDMLFLLFEIASKTRMDLDMEWEKGRQNKKRKYHKAQISKMYIGLEKLQFNFTSKPLLIGGKAMEYYGLRKAGADIDLVISHQDHKRLVEKYPEHVKDLYGDIGVCEFGFEIWNQICTFDYDYLKVGAVEKDEVLIVSLEKLLFLKAIAMNVPKYLKDLELVVELILKKAYGKA
jgi:hypothetical protein